MGSEEEEEEDFDIHQKNHELKHNIDIQEDIAEHETELDCLMSTNNEVVVQNNSSSSFKVKIYPSSSNSPKMKLSKSINHSKGSVQSANCFSRFFFLWLYPLILKGRRQTLQIDDLSPILAEDDCKRLGDVFISAWKAQQQAQKSNDGQASLLKTLLAVFGWRYLGLGCIAAFEECVLRIGQPLCLGLLMRYFAGQFGQAEGYGFAAGVILLSAWYIAQHHPFFFALQHNGMQIRISVAALLYDKILKLSTTSLSGSGATSQGQVLNLLSNDLNKLDLSKDFIHYIWIAPLQLAIVLYILWGYFGPTCLTGIAILLLFLPFQSLMAKAFGKLRSSVVIKTDHRLRLIHEVFGAIRAIKCYAWESPFTTHVTEARGDEVAFLRKTAMLRAVNQAVYYVSTKLVIFITLLTYVLLGNGLTAEKVFVTLALYNNVRMTLTLFLPYGLSQLAEVLVSIKRLQSFLHLKECQETIKDSSSSTSQAHSNSNNVEPNFKPAPVSTTSENNVTTKPADFEQEETQESDALSAIKLNNVSATWNNNNTGNHDNNATATVEEYCLSNISLNIPKGSLTAIIGPTGSGKSSLLQVLLRELSPSTGSMTLNGTIAYCSQEPWIFAGSIRENITFGAAPFNPEWYDQVVEACCLKNDFKILAPNGGDLSFVGDHGSCLSGGQKARVSLARTIYSSKFINNNKRSTSEQENDNNKIIYLFDDPLSAVDASVSAHIFNSTFKSLLKGQTILLVTHALQYLGEVDNIICMDHGKVSRQGNLVQLQATTTPSHPHYNVVQQILGGGAGTNSSIKESQNESKIDEEIEDNADLDSNLPKDEAFVPKLQKQQESQETDNNNGLSECSLYWNYICQGANLCTIFLLIASNLLAQTFYTGSDYWLKSWTRTEQQQQQQQLTDHNSSSSSSNSTTSNYNNNEDRQFQIIIYVTIIGLLFAFSFLRTISFFHVCLQSSIRLHAKLFASLLAAPLAFFESTPIGRILNRFTKDINIIDDSLPLIFFDTIEVSLQVLGILLIVCIVNPILLAPSALVCICFVYIRNLYLKSASRLKRLEGGARSPIFSHINTTLSGLATIRAAGAQEDFRAKFIAVQNQHSVTWFSSLAATRWLGITIDWISMLYLSAVTLLLMSGGRKVFGVGAEAEVGLALSSAMALTGLLQWGVKQSAETANQIISVERVLEYTKLKPEGDAGDADQTPKNKPPGIRSVLVKNDEEDSKLRNWPNAGQITFQNVTLRYGDPSSTSNPPTLKGLTFQIQPNEKIGIIGRTGAGKSSIISALLRLVEIDEEPCRDGADGGSGIIIDRINTKSIPLHVLRSKISIIPQEPILFTGSLRFNLDPTSLSQSDDAKLWEILQAVQLAGLVKNLPGGLDAQISDGGSNFSLGQRQLLCLGRVLLKQNKILILDEATANLDSGTDATIQAMIRKYFEDCTVLTVAHRLGTVMDSDKILLLSAGSIQEYDEPYKLLTDSESGLSDLIKSMGGDHQAKYLEIAKEAHDKSARMRNT